MKKKLLIVNKLQFGYHIDTYYYCRYCANSFEITYLCIDKKRERIEVPGIRIVYLPERGSVVSRGIRFIAALVKELLTKERRYDMVFCVYFPGCSLQRLVVSGARLVLDIRSGSIHRGALRRKVENLIMTLESVPFRRITVVSRSLGSLLKLPEWKQHILPLGGYPFTSQPKRFDQFHLLYVGSLGLGRHILKTVEGFAEFLDKCSHLIDSSYHIVGSGAEEEAIAAFIRARGLDGRVVMTGYIHHAGLAGLFARCTIGVSYVPIVSYFDVQPPTKTFEYLVCGMPVIATATGENRRVIDATNGVLIGDTAEDFCRGLQQLLKLRSRLDSVAIADAGRRYEWEQIVNNNLIPYLLKDLR